MKFRVFLVRTFANILILSGFVILGATYLPIAMGEFWFFLKTQKKQEYSLEAKGTDKPSIFARYLSNEPVKIVPVNKSFSLVVEKIDVNAPIVKNVSVVDEASYLDSLDYGIAHASGTALPGSVGNVYLFAHSSLGFFRFSKYATVFNLLRKLEEKDTVHVFYENKDYEYVVIGKEVVSGWDLRPLTRTVMEPTLTLQTCDPPGTTFNRLVVTARLKSVK